MPKVCGARAGYNRHMWHMLLLPQQLARSTVPNWLQPELATAPRTGGKVGGSSRNAAAFAQCVLPLHTARCMAVATAALI